MLAARGNDLSPDRPRVVDGGAVLRQPRLDRRPRVVAHQGEDVPVGQRRDDGHDTLELGSVRLDLADADPGQPGAQVLVDVLDGAAAPVLRLVGDDDVVGSFAGDLADAFDRVVGSVAGARP